MCAPSEWPTQVIILAKAPAFVMYEYSWAVHWAANLEFDGYFFHKYIWYERQRIY